MLTACFFGGAALSAGAGDEIAHTLEGTHATATVTATEETAAESTISTATEAHGPSVVEEPPATALDDSTEPTTHPLVPTPGGEAATPPAGSPDEPDQGAPPGDTPPAGAGEPPPKPSRDPDGQAAPGQRGDEPVAPAPLAPVPLAPEVALPTFMRGPLPDPTPPARRLDPSVARFVLRTAREASVEWEVLLGVVRATNADARAAANRSLVRRLARRLATALAERGRDLAVRAVAGARAADNALALARYYRAVGIETLVRGLRAAKPVLSVRVLTDPRLEIYAGGRRDIEERRVDVRLLALLLYLAECHGDVTVSSLVSGHRTYARPGVVSAHVPGLAVDISALGGVPIAGNQGAGSVTERAVRDILLVPPELQPQQVISLVDLGGASFALSDHSDHIHVGYGPIPAAGGWGRLRDLWQRAGRRYGVPWQVLAAINKIESDFGRNMGPSSAGAVGWMQFMPSTWARWGLDADGNGVASPWDPDDAVFSAARYLAAAGARSDLPRAIFAYNHADWYVRDVLETARGFGP